MNQKETTEKAKKIVSNYTKGSAIVGLLPLPLIDGLVISASQLKMVQSLAELYNTAFSEVTAKAILTTVLGTVIPFSLKTSLLSLCKTHPACTAVVSGLGLSAFSAASTYTIGKMFIMHFESGGTLLNCDPIKMREYYQQHLQQVKSSVLDNYTGVKP